MLNQDMGDARSHNPQGLLVPCSSQIKVLEVTGALPLAKINDTDLNSRDQTDEENVTVNVQPAAFFEDDREFHNASQWHDLGNKCMPPATTTLSAGGLFDISQLI